MTFANDERFLLSQLLLQIGPNQPTLCEGWTTRDLATHLYVREHRPDAIGGMFVGALSSYLDKVSREVQNKPYEEVVREWGMGAPMWNPMRWGDRYLNAAENFVHHEDVRRAQPNWVPRQLPPSATGDLWRAVTSVGKLLLRNSAATVVARRSDGVVVTLVDKSATTSNVVVVSGDIGELVLWVYGREPVQVQIEGDETLVHRGSL